MVVEHFNGITTEKHYFPNRAATMSACSSVKAGSPRRAERVNSLVNPCCVLVARHSFNLVFLFAFDFADNRSAVCFSFCMVFPESSGRVPV